MPVLQRCAEAIRRNMQDRTYVALEAGIKMTMDFWKTVPSILGALLLLTVPAFAQTSLEAGQVIGLVKDPAQAAVSGSQVVLTNPRDGEDQSGLPIYRPAG
jgi:hypothetical protein